MISISKQSLQQLILTLMLILISSNSVAFQQMPNTEQEVEQSPEIAPEEIQRFSTVISYIKRYYVKPVDDKVLFDNAIRGMLAGLDPHSSYLDEQDFGELQMTTKGEFGGLGIEITAENGLIKVISPIDNSPAKNAGIKAGDYIFKINDLVVKDMTLQEAISNMRGKKGSVVELTILRKDESKPIKLKLTRDLVHIKSVKGELIEDQFAYMRVSFFQEPTVKDFEQTMKKFQQTASGKLKGMILDLRNNPGGLLDSAIQLTDLLIERQNKDKEALIVYTEGRLPGSRFSAYATPGDILKGAPIVVLINEGSASASEIVAGALQDDKRAIIIGTKSFGKGSVQTVLPIDEKRGIKLTTALYYTPAGRSIQAEGIKPDIIVRNAKLTEAKAEEANSLQEAQLKNHLANGNSSTLSIEADAAKTKTNMNSTLANDDYQLNEAINLLKAMVLLKETKKTQNSAKL